ncbi:sensor histidine kinase [Actinophytocola sp.]|uniref:sensor histidine kinase n=1 Tax=Actinophytocola sp. TaxID=1872138 RepID=UPI003D6C24AA
MTPIPVPHRWLAALLGAALLVDIMLAFSNGLGDGLPPLPGALMLCLCAYLALTRPATGALAGTAALIGSSFVIWATDSVPSPMGIPSIGVSETVAGAALVVFVVWRCSVPVAIGCAVALVAACLSAMFIRSYPCSALTFCRSGEEVFGYAYLFHSLVFGVCLLLGSIAVGSYLRHITKQRVETSTAALIRRQWPLGAALAMLLLWETSEIGYVGLAPPIGAVVTGVCAFLAPRSPLLFALAGSAALLVLPVLLGFRPSVEPLSLTGVAATMALIGYAVRYLAPLQAVGATAALVGVNLLMLVLRWGAHVVDIEVMLLSGLLLIVSVAAGWYFRARDRERTQTARAEVTSAQQGERMALARELHDVVAHHVTGIVVQAQAALLVAERNPDVAMPALEKIDRSGTEALNAMRTLVGSLRDGTAAWAAGGADATGQATTDLDADVRALAENFVGPPVTVELSLPTRLPHEVGRSVLRLVQESLTNVGKHAPGAIDVRVRVESTDDQLHIRISDDGAQRPANPPGGSGGYGLVGMRERVELLGGRFEAGPSGDVGWSVEAWLPLRKEGA